MLQYKELYIQGPIGFYVKKIWVIDNILNHEMATGNQILPNGCFNIAFVLGKGAIVQNAIYKKHLINPGIYFCGQHTELAHIDFYPHTKLVMVQLYPWAAGQFLKPEYLKSSADCILPLEYFQPELAKQFKLTDHNCENEIKDFIHFGFPSFIFENEQSPLIYNICVMIMERKGKIRIEEISEELKCSARYFQKMFLLYMGISPKKFSKIIKIRSLADELAYSEEQPLSQLALEYDYFDQPHFINAFRSIVKISPGKFIPSRYFLAFKE